MLVGTGWISIIIDIYLSLFILAIINDNVTEIIIMLHRLLIKCIGCLDTILVPDMSEIPETNEVVENNTCVLTFTNCSRCMKSAKDTISEMNMKSFGNVKVSTSLFKTLHMYQIASWAGFSHVATSLPSFIDIDTISDMIGHQAFPFLITINEETDGELKLESVKRADWDFFA